MRTHYSSRKKADHAVLHQKQINVWSITQLLGFAAIYIAIIWRMKEPHSSQIWGCSEEH